MRVIEAGLGSQLRGRKRTGAKHLGSPEGGALDPYTLAVGNLLLGNEPDAIALELLGGRLRLHVESSVMLVVTGCGFVITVIRDGQYLALAAQTRHRVEKGDELIIQQGPNPGVAYLCLLGGVAADGQTQPNTEIDKAMSLGNTIAQHAKLAIRDDVFFGAHIEMLQIEELSIRVTPGVDSHLLDEQALKSFWKSHWQLSGNRNRMGVYLKAITELPIRAEGAGSENSSTVTPTLTLNSHCVLPGTIQLPNHDSPVLLLADCQTTGGYPKIAKVIDADMWKIIQAGHRARISFEAVTIDEAKKALSEQQQMLYRLDLAISKMSD